MNRRQFIQALAAASAAAAVPIEARTAQSRIVDGRIIDCGDLVENSWRDVGDYVTRIYYSYDVDFTVLLHDGPCDVKRIWADGALIYGEGAELKADLKIRANLELTQVRFENFPLEAFGNRVPDIRAEVIA